MLRESQTRKDQDLREVLGAAVFPETAWGEGMGA